MSIVDFEQTTTQRDHFWWLLENGFLSHLRTYLFLIVDLFIVYNLFLFYLGSFFPALIPVNYGIRYGRVHFFEQYKRTDELVDLKETNR